MSMSNVGKSLLGLRYTKWHDCPASAVSNGRARAVVHTFSEMENVIYSYAWPLNGGKFNIAGGYAYGLQYQVNPLTPPVSGSQVWKTTVKGFLEDSALHFHRFAKSENAFFPDGLEVEVYEYCSNGINPQFIDYFDFVDAHSPYFEYLPETGGYSDLGRGPAPAALTIRFLKKLYSLYVDNDAYKDRIKDLADYLLDTQCVDGTKNWYGAFPSLEGSTYYYSIDAAFAGEAFLDAYEILSDPSYLSGAERCATFLRHMQTRHLAGLVDQYYGGFCEYINTVGGQPGEIQGYNTGMFVKLLLVLPFLKRLFTITGNSLYNTMASDARAFLLQGLTTWYEYYSPQPLGDNQWHRMLGQEGMNDVYADSYAYAIRGLFEYEGLTQTVKDVYDHIKGITGTGYDPKVAWAGYIDVVNNKPDCSYYDMVTAGILAEIKMNYDQDALVTSVNRLIALGSIAFYWGVNFDWTPAPNAKQHTITVGGIGWGLSLLGFGISKDFMIIFFHLKNVGASQINFKLGIYTADYSGYAGTEKYIHPDYSALIKSDGKALIWGSDTAPQDCYMDGSWRTADYSDDTPNSNWLRWNITLNAGAEKLLSFIIIYGDSELNAISNYNIIKAWTHKQLVQEELRFWKDWLNEGKLYSLGIWEIDQLAKINLCLIKSFISQDNYALPSTLGDGYWQNHWPCDAWTCYYALVLWGHQNEAENYFGSFVKEVTAYIKSNTLNLYKSIHICNLLDFTTAQGNYTAEDCFLLPIIAVEAWKRDKSDSVLRDNIWSWIQTFIDEINGDLITYGEWKDHFDHKNIYDAFESWLFPIPHELYGNSSMAVMPINTLLARCYEEIADLAEAKSEYTKASTWRSRARAIRDRFYDFWTLGERANYHYWGDVTGYGSVDPNGWPSWNDMKHVPLPVKPVFRLSWMASISDEAMRKIVQLYHDNYLAYYDGLIGSEPADNWMYGKVERRSNYGLVTGYDMHLWDTFLAAAFLGLDDLAEEFLSRLKAKYTNLTRLGLFDEWPTWNAEAGSGYHMVRTMGLFLVGFAFLLNRLDPIPVKKFLLRLHDRGKEVTILKQTGTSTDQFGNVIQSFEPTYVTKAIVKSLRGTEQIVEAGFASLDDRTVFFKAFTPVDVGDRIRINDVDYAVRTITRHHYKNRVINVDVFAKRAVE